MQNDFEKEVRQKLEELRMEPTPPVWEQVEWQIKPERKRRRFLIWLLFAGLVAGGFFAYNQWNETNTADMREEAAQQTATVNAPAQSQPASTVNKKGKASGTGTSTKRTPQIAASSPGNAGKAVFPSPSNQTNRDFEFETNKQWLETTPLAVIKTFKTGERNTTAATDQQTNNRRQVDRLSALLQVPSININPATLATPFSLTAINEAITATQKIANSLRMAGTDSAFKIVRRSKTGWQKNVSITAGYSGYSTELFDFYKAARADANSLQSGVSGPPVVSAPAYVAPAKIRKGFSFSVSGAISKPVSRRMDVAFGLGYSLYTTRQPFGRRLSADTTITYAGNRVALNGVYTTGDITQYNNRFHSVSLPISIRWQVHQRLPVFAEVSVAYSRVLAVKALAYSPASNFFFETGRDYLKNQLPVSVGLSYRFRLSQTQLLAIGPVAMYNLLRLNETAAQAQHLSFVGIQSSLRF